MHGLPRTREHADMGGDWAEGLKESTASVARRALRPTVLTRCV